MVEIPVNTTDVSNVIIQIPNEPTSVEILLVIGTFTAIGVALLGVFLSNKRTKESNEMMQRELTAKLRPIVKIHGCKPMYGIYDDNSVDIWDNVVKNKNRPPKFARLIIAIENIGSIPCNVFSESSYDSKLIKKEELINDEMKKEEPNTLMPTDTINKTLDIPYNVWQEKATVPLYTGVGVVYKINETTRVEMGKIFQMEVGKNIILKEWYEEIKNS